MDGLQREISAFRAEKDALTVDARQMAALRLACHLDLAEAMKAGPEDRARILMRLRRMIERERLRGARRHWSYDLNRHIALKQAFDRVSSVDGNTQEITGRARRKSKTAPEGAACHGIQERSRKSPA